MGIVLFMSLCFDYPFQKKATPQDKIYKHLANGNYQKYWSYYGKYNLSDSVKSLIQGMLAASPKERLTVA